jgi:aminopeptidase N
MAQKIIKLLNGAALGVVMSATAAHAGEQGRLPTGVTPTHYTLHVNPNATKLSFSGTETVDLIVSKATTTMTLNAADLAITNVKLDGMAAKAVTIDAAAQTATFTFAKPVTTGAHKLSLAYTGKIYQSAAGLFALDYPTKAGNERMLLTQFEAPDARRFAPMWDEPGIKATFTLSVDAPKGQTAFSNMPQTALAKHADGSTTTTFNQTPKMSSYLLFMGVGNVERHTMMSGKTEIGVITRKGAGNQADYALASAARILKYYNNYFGTPYPLPKMDMIAAPGTSQFFGAMENWGAILYFERVLLVDPKISSESDRQDVFGVVAHEMAHQWFGDLVTMKWWDDLWLNEGFASWMATKVTNDLEPEWQADAQNVAGGRQAAFNLDGRSSTHPIIRHILTVDEISSAFDTITYQKGEAVIRMVEGAATPDKFRDGIRAYMAKYKYSNTETDQLWTELEKSSGRPIKDIAHSFTLQGGVPLINVLSQTCDHDQQTVTLSQTRYGLDEKSKAPQTWQVPVTIMNREGTATGVISGSAPQTISMHGCSTFIVDPSQTGYYRTKYNDVANNGVAQAFPTLPLTTQLGIINDSRALLNSGDEPAAHYLALLSAVPRDAKPQLWSTVAGQLTGYDSIFDDAKMQPAFRAKVLGIIRPQWARLGLKPIAGEPSADSLLREQMIGTMAELGDTQAIADIRKAMLQGFADPASLPGSVRRAVLGAYALSIDAAGWDDLHARAKAEKNPLLKQDYYGALGAAQDLGLAQKALDLALTDEVPVPLRPLIIRSVSRNHPALAFDYAVAHADAINALLEESTRAGFIVGLAGNSSDLALADKVKAYAERALPASSRLPATTTVAGIAIRARLRTDLLPAFTTWSQL